MLGEIRVKFLPVYLFSLLFLARPGFCGYPQKAYASFYNPQGQHIGNAHLTETRRGVKIVLNIFGLPEGIHAFHIHGKGVCEPPDFKSAGGHFNPHRKEHGHKNPQGAHAGDLPNVKVRNDQRSRKLLFAPKVTLKEGPHSLLGPSGTALVIHEAEDDYTSDPAGNAGARIACGVIKKL